MPRSLDWNDSLAAIRGRINTAFHGQQSLKKHAIPATRPQRHPMIGFEITIDGERACIAAVGDLGVVSVIASWVRRSSRDSASAEAVDAGFEEKLTLDVGGLTHDDDGSTVLVNWLDRTLQVGQRVTLTVIETAQADAPLSRRRQDPALVEQQKRRYYEHLKQEYGDA